MVVVIAKWRQNIVSIEPFPKILNLYTDPKDPESLYGPSRFKIFHTYADPAHHSPRKQIFKI